MRITTFLLAFLSIQLNVNAQGIETKSVKDKKGEIQYYHYQASGSPDEVIIGLWDAQSGDWTAEIWGEELIPIANKRNAKLIVPYIQGIEAYERWAAIDPVKYLGEYTDGSASILSLGSSAVWATRLIDPKLPALIISPTADSVHLLKRSSASAVYILDAVDQVQNSLKDSFAMAGHWVKLEESKSQHPFFVDNYVERIDHAMDWLDSVRFAIHDSVLLAQYAATAGLTGKVPEVLRQGQKIEMGIKVALPGEYTIQVINLSAQVVQEQKLMLGKGIHHFEVKTDKLDWGVYRLEVIGKGIHNKQKFMIRG
ncbi:MAG: hypothetical protein R2813_13745 [Flavobacteriales bacterium]